LDQEKEHAAGQPDSTREWLLQLERRVTELEHVAAKKERARRRSLLFMLLAGVLYVVVVYWEMNQAFR
jgi:hypothetical protein